MPDYFTYSSSNPKTVALVLLVIGALFELGAAPLIAFGISRPSTPENEMLPFILLLCGLMLAATGAGLLAIGVRLRFFRKSGR